MPTTLKGWRWAAWLAQTLEDLDLRGRGPSSGRRRFRPTPWVTDKSPLLEMSSDEPLAHYNCIDDCGLIGLASAERVGGGSTAVGAYRRAETTLSPPTSESARRSAANR